MIVVIDTLLRIVREILLCTMVSLFFFAIIVGWKARG